MNKKLFLTIALYFCLFGFVTKAQNIVQVEYFFDVDPGFGKATSVQITPAKDITVSFLPDISSLNNGMHTFYTRSKDASGVWSVTNARLFYNSGSLAPSKMNRVEYFFDVDPGFGKGASVPNISSTDTTLSFLPDISALNNGMHTFYTRSKDANGLWSVTNARLFYNSGSLSLPKINRVEYFYDVDPGFGKATAVFFPSNIDVNNLNFSLEISTLSKGIHQLYIRSMDAYKNWSITNASLFYYAGSEVLPNIKRTEYFIDIDPGFGNAISLNTTPVTESANVLYNIEINSLSKGNHYLNVRSLDDNGVWSITNMLAFNKTMAASFFVNGRIINPLLYAVNTANIVINGAVATSTGINGNYSVEISSDSSCVVMPSKSNDLLVANGVNGTDISLIQSHILKKVILNSPFKLIAADVNNDGTVNGTDIALIKSLILKHIAKFSGNRLWAFVDSSYSFPIPAKPFPYYDSIRILSIKANQVGKSFIGIKLGDVNYDWNAAILGANSFSRPIELFNDRLELSATTTEVRIPIKVKNFKNIMGMQYTLNFNSDVLVLKAVENNHLHVDYNTDYTTEGKLPFLWVDASSEARTLPDSTVLFELVFDKKGYLSNEVINLSSDVTAISAFDANYNTIGIVKLNGAITDKLIADNSISIYPNPTKDLISIQSSQVSKIEIIDLMGKVIKSISLKGTSNPTIHVGTLPSGTYQLRLQLTEGTVKLIKFMKD